ncbi:SdpI family protein [Shouchella clausii]|uniref:SdpI family protein n=1 Tax=Shouchella rhizosphaerae TaxID=866786 RepID=A0ABZ2CZT2_9BACI|nr:MULTISPECIES: SdpI family protein [Shouchella]MCM3311333.1 SdpI family protein [Psychrobacillus sp. MER TA 17]MBU3231429.1 SdpI family protein [Shouchella clausii]MBU3263568.1 SdpI family protein [Shouchella clausii]MBU3507959.1 SdpI family protein [Shouchella clausii]MBU3536252.1 SdpI family protein [Shouchella clausii]
MNLRWVFVIVLILSLLHGAVLLDNTGRVADLGVTILMVISISLGIMTVVLGYFGTKAKPNLAFGVRTKWALSNDEVWKRSNLLGGKLLLIVGFAFIITAFPARYYFRHMKHIPQPLESCSCSLFLAGPLSQSGTLTTSIKKWLGAVKTRKIGKQ